MLKPCEVIEVCSPRGPIYSGKLIARAVELYLNGVKTGYIRWHELQQTLEKEFPGELQQADQDKPAPETVMAWARKYPDAPERLRQLGVQQASPDPAICWRRLSPLNGQPPHTVSVSRAGVSPPDINTWFTHIVALMALAMTARCVKALVQQS